jgi:cyanophycin synthetase
LTSPTTTQTAITLQGAPAPVPGYIDGLRHKALYVSLKIELSAEAASWLPALEAKLVQAFADQPGAAPGRPQPAEGRSPADHLAECILYWVYQAHFACRLPVYQLGAVKPDPRSPHAYQLLIPCVDRAYSAAELALKWVIGVFNAAAADNAVTEGIAHLPAMLHQMVRTVGLPGNTPPYLRAAWDLEVPCDVVELPIYQMGQGRRGRWMDSTLTDQTSQMAARLARNKFQSASILRKAGMPGPIHFLVSDSAHALEAAKKLGYPVVVKPADLDRGTAVAAGLETEEEVVAAFAAAAKWTRKILVEKHFHGRDYRVTVFNGRMIWAVERIHGGVTGDGEHTVAQLVEVLNTDPRRGKGAHALMKILELDAEADKMLARQELTRDSVPEPGRFVPLRRASNVAVGGTPVPVMEQVHPDNRDLAIRATAALRLDFGGVDFVIPDIARSWLETGALICEVNSQPSIGITGTHLYPSIIQQLVEGNGRIPIAVIVGAPDPDALGTALSQRLAQAGFVTGWGTRERAMVGSEQVAVGPLTAFHRGQAVLGDQRVGAVLLFLNALGALQTGLPFARFDVLALAGTTMGSPGPEPEKTDTRAAARMKAALLPACDGVVLEGVPPDDLVEAIASALTAADDKHRRAFQ